MTKEEQVPQSLRGSPPTAVLMIPRALAPEAERCFWVFHHKPAVNSRRSWVRLLAGLCALRISCNLSILCPLAEVYIQ